MAFNRLFADDEELGKKDDDFRPRNPAHDHYGPRSPWLSLPRTRRRRLVVTLVLIAVVYLFIKNMPPPLPPSGDLIDMRDPTRTLKGVPVKSKQGKAAEQRRVGQDKSRNEEQSSEISSIPSPPSELKSEEVPPILRGSAKTAEHYYDGPLKFFKLPESLHGITHTNGYKEDNKNVLFAAANAQSASRLIPLACEMARYNRNHVHFAFLGRDPISMDQMKEVNGAVKDCAVYWHDGRPDKSEVSNDARMEYSVTSALFHIQTYMHPQAYIIDEIVQEERYFVEGIHSHTRRIGKSLIELPKDAAERMMWITRLDHSSLAAWDAVYIDLLIHVPPGSSGSLIRLLKSIEDADYFGARTPHLTIELPPHVDPAAQRFLDGFTWPPMPKDSTKHMSKITLRKRVSTAHLSPLEASIRTVESFYSARPSQSHVLLLSTQAELSPLYYQYILYNVLEYGYGWYSRGTYLQNQLAGIALDLPSVKLNGDAFSPPGSVENSPSPDKSPETSFLWQVPDTHAALYFGGKWREFHSYLSYRTSLPPPESQKKMVSASFPAFAEPLLELMRARNWFMLFPHLPNGNTLATIHNELATAPEEYTPPEAKSEASKPKPITPDMYLEPAEPPLPLTSNNEQPLLSTSLVALLPDDADLPELHTLPLLAWDAYELEINIAARQAEAYETNLRRTIGKCPPSHIPRISYGSMSADDLFCASSDPEPATMIDAKPPSATTSLIASADDTHEDPGKSSDKSPEDNNKAAIDKELKNNGLDFDSRPAPEAPNPAKPGEMRKGASMDEIVAAEKEKALKQMNSEAAEKLIPNKPPGATSGQNENSGKAGIDGKKSDNSQSEKPGSGDTDKSSTKEQLDTAMQKEFKAHLERLGNSPDKMQAQVEEKLKKDIAAGKDKEENKVIKESL